jgi:hypothetical protein
MVGVYAVVRWRHADEYIDGPHGGGERRHGVSDEHVRN